MSLIKRSSAEQMQARGAFDGFEKQTETNEAPGFFVNVYLKRIQNARAERWRDSRARRTNLPLHELSYYEAR